MFLLGDLRPSALADVGPDDGDKEAPCDRFESPRQHAQQAVGPLQTSLVSVDVWIRVIGKGHDVLVLPLTHDGMKIIRGHHGHLVAEQITGGPHDLPLSIGVGRLGDHRPVQREEHAVELTHRSQSADDFVTASLEGLLSDDATVRKTDSHTWDQFDIVLRRALDETTQKTLGTDTTDQRRPPSDVDTLHRVVAFDGEGVCLVDEGTDPDPFPGCHLLAPRPSTSARCRAAISSSPSSRCCGFSQIVCCDACAPTAIAGVPCSRISSSSMTV